LPDVHVHRLLHEGTHRRLFLHFNIDAKAFQLLLLGMRLERFEVSWLMAELVRCKRLMSLLWLLFRMLMIGERIRIVEDMRSQRLWMETRHCSCRRLLSYVHCSFGSRHRERRAESHGEAWRMKVAGLMMIDGVRSTRSRCVVAWRLICEIGEGEAVWIQY
jgi:hypothetical protein